MVAEKIDSLLSLRGKLGTSFQVILMGNTRNTISILFTGQFT